MTSPNTLTPADEEVIRRAIEAVSAHEPVHPADEEELREAVEGYGREWINDTFFWDVGRWAVSRDISGLLHVYLCVA